MGFHNSDHRGCYVDIDCGILDMVMEEPADLERQRLVSKNIPMENKYAEELNTRLDAHNIRERLGKLNKGTENGKISKKWVHPKSKDHIKALILKLSNKVSNSLSFCPRKLINLKLYYTFSFHSIVNHIARLSDTFS